MDVYLIEESIYYYDSIWRPIKPSKIKIAYLRACMRSYYDLLKDNHDGGLRYIEYLSEPNVYKIIANKYRDVSCYDPTDHALLQKLQESLPNINVIPSIAFIATPKQMSLITTSRQSNYYKIMKDLVGGILADVPSQDKTNRAIPPKDHNWPVPIEFNLDKYYNEAKRYASRFKDHRGEPDQVIRYPINSPQAKYYFKQFLKHRMANFGKYQDAIIEDESLMYHSNISAALNVGIIRPSEIVKMTRKYCESADIPINSYEGFIRQVLGWREYCRYMYTMKYQDMVSSNLPNNNRTFKDWKAWQDGTTGIYPIDQEIIKVNHTGYSHHIVRLMMFLNFFILVGIHPKEIYKWFMETICIDAYDWVMVFNVWGMGYFYKGAMSRPYISSSNYILRMSNYRADNHWNILWDGLFYNSIIKKPIQYVGYYSRNAKHINHTEVAIDYIKSKTVEISNH